MKSYPPVDPDFYVIGANSGLSDEEIQKDWEVFCDDLAQFHSDLDEVMQENAPALPERDTVAELKALIEDLKA